MTVGLILGLSACVVALAVFSIHTTRRTTDTWLKALLAQQERHELRSIELVGRIQSPSPLALAAFTAAPTQEDSKPPIETELPTPADLDFVLVDETDHYALRGDDS